MTVGSLYGLSYGLTWRGFYVLLGFHALLGWMCILIFEQFFADNSRSLRLVVLFKSSVSLWISRLVFLPTAEEGGLTFLTITAELSVSLSSSVVFASCAVGFSCYVQRSLKFLYFPDGLTCHYEMSLFITIIFVKVSFVSLILWLLQLSFWLQYFTFNLFVFEHELCPL